MFDDLLTTREVAKRFGVSQAAVQYWIKNGYLLGRKVGRDLLVYAADIETFTPPTRGRSRRAPVPDEP